MSVAPIPQIREFVHNVQIQRLSCFVDNVSSRTKLTLCLCSAVEGAGIDLIELICLALSVLSRLLQLSPDGVRSSPIVSSLSARPAGRSDRHFVTVVAQYIYHRHSPQLPTLSTKLLSTLSGVSRYFYLLLCNINKSNTLCTVINNYVVIIT